MPDSQKSIKTNSIFDNFISDVRDYIFLFSILIGLSTALIAFSDKITIGSSLNQALFFIFFLILIIWFHITIKGVPYFRDVLNSEEKSFTEIISSLEIILFCFLLIAPFFLIFSLIFQQSPGSFLAASFFVVALFGIFGTNMFAEWMKIKYNTIKSSLCWVFGCILSFIVLIVIFCLFYVYNNGLSYYLAFLISPIIGILMMLFINSTFLLIDNLNEEYFHLHPINFIRDKIRKH